MFYYFLSNDGETIPSLILSFSLSDVLFDSTEVIWRQRDPIWNDERSHSLHQTVSKLRFPGVILSPLINVRRFVNITRFHLIIILVLVDRFYRNNNENRNIILDLKVLMEINREERNESVFTETLLTYELLIDWLVCCLLSGPDLWKRILLKYTITMVFSWPLLSWCKFLSPFKENNNMVVFPIPFQIFVPLAYLWFTRL